MKTKSTRMICLLALLLIQSCTIQKRLFQPGYSIEWKKKAPQKNTGDITDRLSNFQKADTATQTSFPEARTNLEGLKQDPISIATDSSKASPGPETQAAVVSPAKASEKPVAGSGAETPKPTDIIEPEAPKELELFGTMSFGLYICGLTLAIVGIITLSSPFYAVAAAFMILLSLVFGIISVSIYRKDRSRYYRNFFGYFGLIASAATLTFTIALLLVAFGLGSF